MQQMPPNCKDWTENHDLHTVSDTEPFLTPNPFRYVLFPIQYQSIFDFYKRHLASFWTAEEIDFSQDLRHFDKLTADEKFFILHILAFFAASDGIVNENLATNFITEVQVPEARAFWTCQELAETIHSETYSLLIDTYVKDADEKLKLFHAIENFPAIKNKAEWAINWMNKERTFPERLVAFCAVEGVHFSGAFASIFYLKKRGLMPGLGFANELISRDEGLHTDFAVHLYSLLQHKLSDDTIVSIITSAVDIEKEFITESLPCDLIGMNKTLMMSYIEFVADRLLLDLGVAQKHYNTSNPFEWMELISMTGKSNFFERRVSEYAKAGVMSSANMETIHSFSLEEDF